MKALLLQRHGQTDYNFQRRFQGQRNIELNSIGREQAARSAEIVCNLIQDIFEKEKLDTQAETLVFSSDLARALETCEITHRCALQKGLNLSSIHRHDSLREWHVGDLEGFTVEEYERENPSALQDFFRRFEQDPYATAYPGPDGESRNDLYVRVRSVLRTIEERAATITLLSSHGAWIQAFLECLNLAKVGEGNVIGNGDVILLRPKETLHQWTISRHYKIGTNVSAKV